MKRRMERRTVYYGTAILVCCILIGSLIQILCQTKKPKRRETKAKQEANEKQESENIRVLLKTNGFQELVHPQVQIKSEQGLKISYGAETKNCAGEEILTVNPDDAMFQSGKIRIEALDSGKITIVSLNRGYGTPSYRGIIELITTAEGIAVINELPMEQYLYAVVPSEMPSSYELEALKVQAVSARSYAYCQTRDYAYPEYEAHVDDSTEYQVYGNSQEQESTIRAVDETKGEKLWYKNQVVKTYYFSTSCGKTTNAEAWGSSINEENAYLQGVAVCDESGDYERNLPWYRWTAEVPEELLGNLIELNTKTELGVLQSVEVTKRGVGDVALQVVATGDKGSATIESENKIRKALGGSGYTLKKQDGTEVKSTSLLPSAFITITKNEHTYIIQGGGYGHGIGMSQNAANEMAKAGKTYREILQFFYHDGMIGS